NERIAVVVLAIGVVEQRSDKLEEITVRRMLADDLAQHGGIVAAIAQTILLGVSLLRQFERLFVVLRAEQLSYERADILHLGWSLFIQRPQQRISVSSAMCRDQRDSVRLAMIGQAHLCRSGRLKHLQRAIDFAFIQQALPITVRDIGIRRIFLVSALEPFETDMTFVFFLQ